MDIKQAKGQLEGAVRAYLSKDDRGLYRIPPAMQRPVLMMGPPGVGKTAIVSQVARDLGINLVSYSITHHTRQTAIGLPFIVEREFGGKTYRVSEYTMSEIIGSAHDAVRRTGVGQGILFLDEVNCVSETLAPAMLQFLQFKTFGQHRLPEGWVIVCAGNPPAYNRAAREFDPAMMDRLKCIHVEPDVRVWLEYAGIQGVHPAILSYLEAKPDAFYLVRASTAGMRLVTARGWEDLSRMILAYEAEGIPVDEELVSQYLQDDETAQDFAIHYELFRLFRETYDVAALLEGDWDEETLQKAADTPSGERMAVAGMLADSIRTRFHAVSELEQALRLAREDITGASVDIDAGSGVPALVARIAAVREAGTNPTALKGVEVDADAVTLGRLRVLEQVRAGVARAQAQGHPAYEAARAAFNAECRVQGQLAQRAVAALENAFRFLDEAFDPNGVEVTAFTARLAADPPITSHIASHGGEAFLAHNRELLVADKVDALMLEMGALEDFDVRR